MFPEIVGEMQNTKLSLTIRDLIPSQTTLEFDLWFIVWGEMGVILGGFGLFINKCNLIFTHYIVNQGKRIN